MADDLPYKVEYAKSGRAACKGCKSKIDNAELRLAVMVQVSEQQHPATAVATVMAKALQCRLFLRFSHHKEYDFALNI